MRSWQNEYPSQVFLLGFAGAAANLGKEQINTERRFLVGQEALELSDLLAEHIRGVTNTTEHTETTSVGDSGGQLGAGSHVHTCQQDGVVDLQKIGDRSANSFYSARH